MDTPFGTASERAMRDLTPYFAKGIYGNKNFHEALEIAQRNSGEGSLWVIGGLVYRNIIENLYGRQTEETYDFDFLVETPIAVEHIKVSGDWTVIRTGLGEPRFVSGQKQIDLVTLDNAINPSESERLSSMDVAEKLASYFRRVPLNIQALAYDMGTRRVIGDVGIQAILSQTIEINNLDECLSFCKRRKISIREFIDRKKNVSGFEATYPGFTEHTKEETEKFYDTYFTNYVQTRADASFVFNYLEPEFTAFVEHLSGKRVLDLGSGPGRDALLLQAKGLQPLCVDISVSMVTTCREKGLEAVQMDMENLDFEKNSFDGVWAYASLVHIPKKRVFNTIARIREILKPGGIFFVGMIEGDAEMMHQSKDKPDRKRFFALYRHDEFKHILSDYFTILSEKDFSTSRGERYLNYLCQKK